MFKRQRSLSATLTGYVVVMGIVIIAVAFFLFEYFSKQVLYDIEKEKAKLIAEMFAPQIGINLYLGMDDRVVEALRQLLKQKEIVAVKLYCNGRVCHDLHKSVSAENGIVIETSADIYRPGDKSKIGKLVVDYVSYTYNAMLLRLTKMFAVFLLLLALFYALTVYLIRKRLYPLKELANSLVDYSVKNPVKFKRLSSDREIRQIEEAVEKMQEKIEEYTRKLTHLNENLHIQVEQKTKKLWDQLYSDSLTGLPNRRAMMRDLPRIHGALLAIANIDDFTEINDLYGHHVGDEILKQLGAKLSSMNFDALYRASGDEFVFIVKKKFTPKSALELLKRIREEIENTSFLFEENRIDLRISIGASIEYMPTIEQADMALKEARKQRVPIMLFSQNWQMKKRYKENIQWVSEIKSALEDGRIEAYGQPLYDIRHHHVKGYEVLMRLIKKDGTVVSPFHFLSLAQKTHYYPKMTRHIVEQSCIYFENRKEFTFSVNLSVEDILNAETVEFIKERVEKHHVANRIIFELLESENIENYPEVAIFIEDMKHFGCKIAIDDFGTGYSNFSYLTSLDVDYIKIDGSLIKNVHKDKNLEIIAETIIDFAQRLNIKTVAEFVCDEAVYEKVCQMGVDIAQGYYIDEPRPLRELEEAQKSLRDL
ncbi:EAL domain-containing protein [Hydrogenimonas sp.]